VRQILNWRIEQIKGRAGDVMDVIIERDTDRIGREITVNIAFAGDIRAFSLQAGEDTKETTLNILKGRNLLRYHGFISCITTTLIYELMSIQHIK
jgi:hypothetical protein